MRAVAGLAKEVVDTFSYDSVRLISSVSTVGVRSKSTGKVGIKLEAAVSVSEERETE